MELSGAVIHSGGELLAVQNGWVHGFHQDRRTPWAETRVGEAARRRKPPPEMMTLVGTGRLWVAKGEFEIHFPKRFTLVMKALALLPPLLYFPAIRKFTGL